MNNLESVPGTASWNFLDHLFITCIGSVNNFNEALLSLSVLALPENKPKYKKSRHEKRGVKVEAETNLMLLKKEI